MKNTATQQHSNTATQQLATQQLATQQLATNHYRLYKSGTVLLFSIMFSFFTPQLLTAQNWTGTTGTSTNLYRQGNIGVGFTTAPTCGSPLESNGDINMNLTSSALRIACTPVLSNLGANNLFVGDNAGTATTTGIQNTFLGYSSGLVNTTGGENTFVGDRSGVANIGGNKNSFLGTTTGFSNTSGNNNLFFGYESGYNNTTGSDNVFIGYQSGRGLTTNDDNTFVGFSSGTSITTATNATILGSNAGGNTGTIFESVLIGTEAGYDVLGGNSTSSSVIIGYQAATAEGGGSANTVIGYGAAQTMNRFAVENTLVGFHAGTSIQMADANVLVGSSAGSNITTGFANTLICAATNSGPTNQNNVALGNGASIATGFDGSTAIGAGALVSAGNNSTALGVNSVACAPNTIAIGTNAEVVTIGNCFAPNAPAGGLEVLGQAWAGGVILTSDRKLKREISTLENSIEKIMKLNGYTYRYKDSAAIGYNLPQDLTAGVMAQELIETFPYAVKVGTSGNYGVDYNQLIPLLIEGIKEQQGKIEELEKLLATERDGNKPTSKAKPTGRLAQNNPNPFSGTTEIEYEIFSEFEQAEVRLYDMSGNLEFSQNLFMNNATISVDGQFLNPGIYAYTLIVDGYSVETRTMVVSK